MPHCPRCGIRYKTDIKITRHLNHPCSSCTNLINDLISVLLPNTSHDWRTVNISLEEELHDHDSDHDTGDGKFHAPVTDTDVEMATGNSGSINNIAGCSYCDEFADAAKTWGCGETFMDIFDLDGHAEQCRENVYYPFASKEDWEMAAYLLHLGLSMALIDNFLSLQLMSTLPCDAVIYHFM